MQLTGPRLTAAAGWRPHSTQLPAVKQSMHFTYFCSFHCAKGFLQSTHILPHIYIFLYAFRYLPLSAFVCVCVHFAKQKICHRCCQPPLTLAPLSTLRFAYKVVTNPATDERIPNVTASKVQK